MYWQIPLWIYCWNLYHLPTNESYEDAAVLPLSVLRNMQVKRKKMMSCQHRTFTFSAQKSISDLGVSSNRVHIYIIGLSAVRYIPVISAREGTAPAEGDFWTECWLVKSAAFMWMGQQWHFQAIRYVIAQREKAAGAKEKGNDKTMNETCDDEHEVFLHSQRSRTFILSTELIFSCLSFFFFPWTQRNRLMVRGGRMRACSEVKQKVRPVSILLYCSISCRLCILKMHCLAFGSSFFFFRVAYGQTIASMPQMLHMW